MKTKEIIKRARELAKPFRIGGDRSSGLTRSCVSRGGRIKTQGTGHSEKEIDEQVALAVVERRLALFRLAVNRARC